MTLKFEFINHSCFTVTYKDKSLTVDPWLEGSVFNKSWNLLVETPTKSLQTVKKSDYVWFSHEHPDHFNPPNIKMLPLEKNYLFQKTRDKRVINYLRKFSKKVFELNSDEVFNISDNFSIQVMPFQDLDSFCIIKVDGLTILNLNDCDIKNKKELDIIKKKAGKIDILFAQFSYAIGKSNKNEKTEREGISKDILVNLSNTISYLNPAKVVPFASFCFFSRKDNFYLNDSINKVDETINFLKQNHPKINFLCFYPGDTWDLRSKWNNENSVKKYIPHYKKILPSEYDDKIIEFDSLKLSADKFIYKTKINNNLFPIYNFINKKDYNIFFKLSDTKEILKFDFNNGLKKISEIQDNAPLCELTSESLNQLFLSGYGYDALTIGGRYESNKNGEKCLNKIFKFQTKNYQNQFYNFGELIPKFISKLTKHSRALPKR